MACYRNKEVSSFFRTFYGHLATNEKLHLLHLPNCISSKLPNKIVQVRALALGINLIVTQNSQRLLR